MAIAYPAVAIVVAIPSGFPDTEVIPAVVGKVVAVAIKSKMEVSAVVQASIGVEDRGSSVVEVRAVGVVRIDSESPISARVIDGAEEVLYLEESPVLTATEHVAKIVVAHVKQVVVVVDGIVIAEDYVVDDFVDIPEVVVVNLENVLKLSTAESEFVAHAVAQEACLPADFGITEACKAAHADGCQSQRH